MDWGSDTLWAGFGSGKEVWTAQWVLLFFRIMLIIEFLLNYY